MMDKPWEIWWREYKHWVAWGLGGVLVIILFITLTRHPSRVNPSSSSHFQVIGFYQNYSPASGHPGSESSFQAHLNQLTTVSPRWFQVNPSGSVTDIGYDNYVVQLAHQHHVAVMPLFTNAGGSSQVLLTAASRQQAITNIVSVVKTDHLDGVNIDFELLKPSARAGLSLFVTDLASKLHALHKTIGVSVFPLVGLPYSINGADDYSALAKAADYLVVMVYDHHYSGGPPGPVAPFGWVQDNIKAALKQVPASKIVLAIGMYGYDWVDNGHAGPAKTVPDEEVPQLLHKYGVHAHYNYLDSQNWFTYTAASGIKHIVYYMGTRSAQARINLARHDHLAGISLWRLGFEEPNFWSVIPRK
ncbi:glycosyl hydrolase family 18 protein [Sulfobacillus thermosulfidooxidans]|uniref:glycosyl hydrolase family 18 protein n=1 Tax=Sulfobacillus thermosulfidooxidans TaxID=28034 RepID=UPI0004167CD7|nr:glycosyl hydrolase family 18 protein [Sulfobacillus thermosulfidooxidans]